MPGCNRLREYSLPTAIAAATIVLGLLVAEVVLRLLHGLAVIPDRNLILERMLATNRWQQNEYHPVIGWAHKANLTLKKPLLSTGEFGVRMNQNEIRPVPRGAILAVGDSFTEGSEVGNAESWPAALERQLGEPVVNAGIGGYGPDQMVLMAEELIPRLAPKMIIVSLLSVGIDRVGYSIYGGGTKSYFVVENGELVHRNVPVPKTLSGASSELNFAQRWLAYSYLVDTLMLRLKVQSWYEVAIYARVKNDHAAVTCLLLARLRRETEKRGIRLVVMMQYGGDNVLDNITIPDTLSVIACSRDLGIETLDTWDRMRDVSTTDEPRLRTFYTQGHRPRPAGHMTGAGNEFIASLVTERLRDRNSRP